MSLLLVLFHATMRKLSMGNECHSVYGLSVCPSLLVYLFIVCLSVTLLVYLFIVCLFVCLSICHSPCLSVYCLSVTLLVCLSVYCLSVTLILHLFIVCQFIVSLIIQTLHIASWENGRERRV